MKRSHCYLAYWSSLMPLLLLLLMLLLLQQSVYFTVCQLLCLRDICVYVFFVIYIFSCTLRIYVNFGFADNCTSQLIDSFISIVFSPKQIIKLLLNVHSHNAHELVFSVFFFFCYFVVFIVCFHVKFKL